MQRLFFSIFICLITSLANAQATKTLAGDQSTGTSTWSKDTVYILDGFVFVDSLETLTIEAGTVIKGVPGQGADASALIVARGGTIIAQGTASAPIIFTAQADDLANPFDIAENTRGLWGGVLILGNAPLNSTPGQSQVEGLPTEKSFGLYGGNDSQDDSGIFSYASIRYGGTNIGSGNEINGLTLAGVGSATQIDHVEVIFNKDDGVEFFGGNPNTSYMVTAFCGDDAFDYDEGFDGLGQFWFVVQSDSAGSDRGGEHDGGTDPETASPFATPVIYNATYIGRGEAAGKRALTFRDNAGGEYHNSIFMDYGKGVDIEILGNGGTHSFDRLLAGNLKVENNIFWNVAGNDSTEIFQITPAKYVGQTLAADSAMIVDSAAIIVRGKFLNAGNLAQDPLFANVEDSSRLAGYYKLDPRPGWDGPAFQSTKSPYPADPFYKSVNYKGAFDNSADLWLRGWTLLDEMFYIPTNLTSLEEELAAQFDMTVAPNPNNGRFSVTLQNLTPAENVKFTLFNLQGQLVDIKSAMPTESRLEVDFNTSNIAAGLYILKVVQGQTFVGLDRILIK
ncbi:MAG: T9SS type A sorting domain-containing protein [Bacteroidia bacterium]